nr:hypothetical protein RVX_2468 [Nitratidesulfovibrio sp. HK-II]
MVQAPRIGGPDVHGRALADGSQTLEDRDAVCGIGLSRGSGHLWDRLQLTLFWTLARSVIVCASGGQGASPPAPPLRGFHELQLSLPNAAGIPRTPAVLTDRPNFGVQGR